MAKRRHVYEWEEPQKKHVRRGVSPRALSEARAISKGERTVEEVFEEFDEKHDFGKTFGQERAYGKSLKRALLQLYHRGEIDESELDGARLDISDYLSGRAESEEEEHEDYD